jgi:hypothetical protein
MTVIGNIDIGVQFTSATNLGTVTAGIPSLLSIEATAVDANRVLEYSVTAGSLPTGLTLSPTGNIIGSQWTKQNLPLWMTTQSHLIPTL